MPVLVIGIVKKLVQPVAFLTADGAVRSAHLLLLPKQLISTLKLCNLVMKSIVCDQGGCNCVVAKKKQVSIGHFFIMEETKV